MKKRQSKKKTNQKSSINSNQNPYLISLRYLILLIIMIFGLSIIYSLLTPITVSSVVYILKMFYSVQVTKSLIILNSQSFIQIIPACIAGSAHLLLLILNLTVQMDFKKRIYSIVFSFASLFILNVLRIIILSVLLENNNPLFDITHKLFWYGLSTLFVVLIWFLNVKLFSIKEIPVYSDIKSLAKAINK